MESFTQQAMIETETMAEAWRWLCHSRRNTPANADIWHLRFHWAKQRDEFWQRVQGGQYRLSPMQVNYRRDGDSLAQWCAPDALALKWAALQIQHALPVQPSCHHVAGCRGGRNSLSQIDALIKEGYQYVYRTDIRGYYRHINKTQLWLHVCRYVSDTAIQKLLHQYIWYAVEQGGEIVTPPSGISRGCALSPLLGASFLWRIDSTFSNDKDLFYARYMDDFIFLSPRRWPVKRATKRLLHHFDLFDFSTHPDKTQMGRISKGFDWLGVWFTQNGAAGIAPRALTNHHTRRLRLEEQARKQGLSERAIVDRVQEYEKRWNIWARSMLHAASCMRFCATLSEQKNANPSNEKHRPSCKNGALHAVNRTPPDNVRGNHRNHQHNHRCDPSQRNQHKLR